MLMLSAMIAATRDDTKRTTKNCLSFLLDPIIESKSLSAQDARARSAGGFILNNNNRGRVMMAYVMGSEVFNN